MSRRKRDAITLISLVILLLVINYSTLDEKVGNFLTSHETEDVFINRVIDGDTIVSGDRSIRLLGINTPERGKIYYTEAKEFLEARVLNQTVTLQFGKEKYDIYERTLAYVLSEGKNVNIEIVENGFANYYFPSGKDVYYNDFREAWNVCIEKAENLCKKSDNVCSSCIKLEEFNYRSDEVVFSNQCNLKCNLTGWEIKDEGRKIFVFPKFSLDSGSEVTIKTGNGTNTEKTLFWRGETYVWTQTGDTLFLRDKEGELVLWENF